MKNKFLFSAFIALCLAFTFTSCNEDDDNSGSGKIAGTYTGALEVMDSTSIEDITLSNAGENRVKILLKDFSFGPMSIGDISAICDVIETEGEYYLSGSTTVTVMGVLTIPVSVSGEVYGNVLELDLDIDLSALGQGSINVSFEGAKSTQSGAGADEDEEDDLDSAVVINPLNKQIVGEWKATHVDGMKFPSYVSITMRIGADGTFWEHTYIPAQDDEEDTEESIIEGEWSLEGKQLYVQTQYYKYYLNIVNVKGDTMKTSVDGQTFTWERI